MINRRNYYRILNVQPEAPTAVIQASYRAMMQKCRMHPDLGGDHEIASIINQAYETLLDPHKRAEYDKTLNQAQRTSKETTNQQHCIFCGLDYTAGTVLRCEHCGIPFTPAQKILNTSPHDKRALTRLPKLGEILYTSDPLFPYRRGQCRELTPLGMRMIIPEALTTNTLIKCENASMMATARVIHCEDVDANHSQIGVEFITLAFTQGKSQFVDQQA